MKHIPRLIFLASSCWILTSCSATKWIENNTYRYDFAMIKPDSTGHLDTTSILAFQDDKLNIGFSISTDKVNFTIENKTDKALKILWDDASIVRYGKAGRTMHAGVKYTNSTESQPPTSVPPKASIDECIIPSENVYYTSGSYTQFGSIAGGWNLHDLFPSRDVDGFDGDDIMKLKGQQFSVFLPIKCQEKTYEYNFTFLIKRILPPRNPAN